MAFDQPTRSRLQKLVNRCRSQMYDEFSIQLQQTYGLDPKTGEVTPMARLTHLNDRQRHTAEVLRQTLAHYLGADADDTGHRVVVLDRMVREQAFTVLNRLAALLMMEARGQLIESVSKGYQSRGYQLYNRIAGTGLGETGQAYQVYLFSVFDELAQELPTLFDRYASNGLLFPRDIALRALLEELNHFEIEPLWAADETIGWIYQYFNSKEERKAMRDASQAPRNSRELAVRNQFFTPRYVVEFLVDNTLGRLWFNATGGQTNLGDRCQYLLVKAEEQPQVAFKLRDPRTLKLLDPACGSMHFGLYAFDLFTEIYHEAWAWEQRNGPGSLDVSTQPQTALQPLCQTYDDEAAFLRDVPRLIIENNIYGVDIDPRAAQIATLALWLRAQRAWHDDNVKATDRPRIGQGHVVAAVAPPAERLLRQQLATNLGHLDAELFEKTLQLLKGLPELGVLLQVELELPHLIRQVFGEHGSLFKEADMQQWQKAEARLRVALTEFVQAAKSTYQGRLFAQDALQGLRLIDLCREEFDVLVMNPPFGAISLGVKEYLVHSYPDSKNDLLGIFVDRGLSLLRPGGRLGAITSRACFFLTSFTDWRTKVVLGRSAVEVIADLGQGVMDDAMVEAAAYVLERGATNGKTKVIRAIADDNRREAMAASVAAFRNGTKDARLFEVETNTFDLLPNSPFVYWVDSYTAKQFKSDSHFEPNIGEVRVGLQTGDDPRFVRTVWEVPPKNTQFCYYPTDEGAFCSFDDPIVQAYFSRRHEGEPRWAFHVKAGASQPWYSPITLKVNWHARGAELRNFTDAKGKLRSRPQNVGFYYRPGFSWTRRAVRFYPYVIPSGCIPSVSRYMAFPEAGREIEALGVCASRLSSAFMRFYAEFWQRPNFLVENVKMLPWPQLSSGAHDYFSSLISQEVEKRRQAYQNFEPFHEFVLPAKIRDFSNGGTALAFNRHSLLGEEGERLVAGGYGFTPQQAEAVERDLREAIELQHGSAADSDDDESSNEDSDFVLDTSTYATEEAHLSYLMGCVFGRWDIRFAMGSRNPERLPNPFSPLPVCPPGMLQNNKGLPAKETELQADYPLSVAWSGVLVDDEGHPSDVVEKLRDALRAIWGLQAESIEEAACVRMGNKSLRDYFARSSGFFADHLKRYSKSSRKAPIYWPLSTTSNSYTIWIYYPNLNNQTLFTAVNDFLDGPNGKLTQVNRECAELRIKSSRSRDEEKQYETLQTFERELADLRDSLLKIALSYQPNLDDGVQITAAPLWSLFRHKPWQKVLKETWVKLEKGDYDWAYLAMAYWPERLREKCKTDKSLAIAHGIEELYIEPVAAPRKHAGKKKAGTNE